jgi:hypothetical protein
MVQARLIAKPAKRSRVRRFWIGILLLPAVPALALAANPHLFYAMTNLLGVTGCGGTASNSRNASTTLKTIVAAQYDYHDNDRDGNLRKDFWRGDIAGLYTQHYDSDPAKDPMKLIELSTASADDRPVSDLTPYAIRSAKAGYWYRALLHEDEETASPDRFAVVAFPDTPSVSKWMFIVDEENYVYRKKTEGQRGIDRYPKDPLKAGWEKLD